MKTLETEIKNHGHDLKQIKRDGRVAIYERTCKDEPRGYEVIIIRDRPASVAFGKEFPAHEAYPGSEEWGSSGWTYSPVALEKAEQRFVALLPKYGANVAPTPS